MRHGGFYHLTGSVGSSYDFDIHRVIRDYLRIMIPLEFRDRIEFGRVYDFILRSIEEVQLNEEQRRILRSSKNLQYRPLLYRIGHAAGRDAAQEVIIGPLEEASSMPQNIEKWKELGANFDVRIRLQGGRVPRPYFRIDSASFRFKTGVVIEESESYLVRGKIGGVGDFQKRLRSVAARQDIPFYVPMDLTGKVAIGATYTVTIDAIEKMPDHRIWRNTVGISSDDWTWRDIAAWIDTEGSIYAAELGSRYLRIGQKEKKIIQQVCAFLSNNSIECRMFLDEKTGVYYASVDRTDQIAKVIKNVEPFIRTENKKREIAAFKEYLARPRRRLQAVVLEARTILGIGLTP